MIKKYLQSFIQRFNSKNLYLNDFKYVVTNSENIDSEYNKKNILYLDKMNTEIGHIEYNPHTGFLWSFYIYKSEYRNRGLGKQILNNVLFDIKCKGTKKVWLVTNKYPHQFWESNGFTCIGYLGNNLYHYKRTL
jgi:hypothetical protein